jgi:hypothetical protein
LGQWTPDGWGTGLNGKVGHGYSLRMNLLRLLLRRQWLKHWLRFLNCAELFIE